MKTLSVEQVHEALRAVKDPEIPTCSIVDLGIVERVEVTADAVEVDLLPTFAGCPALDVIKQDVEQAVRALGTQARVRFVNAPPWTSDRVTPAGAEALREYGIGSAVVLQIGGKPRPIACPYCGATDTVEESAFGPTPCRTIRYCSSCRNPFEGFKRKG